MTTTAQAIPVIELRSLLQDLVADGRLSQKSMDETLSRPRTRIQAAMHPIVYVGSLNLDDETREGKPLDVEAITYWYAKKIGFEYKRIDPLKIDVQAVTSVMSYTFAKRHKILAVDVDKETVMVACLNPGSTGWEADLEHVSKRTVKKVFCNPADVEQCMGEFYTLAKSVSGASGKDIQGVGGIANLEAMLELGNTTDPDANDQHIVNIVDWLFQYAFAQRASDIHIEPRREIGNIRFRIDGVLHTVYRMPMQVVTAVISRIKILGRLNVAEKRRPQDGRLKTKTLDGQETELRLSTMPTAFGEKLVMRIFDPEVLLKNFQELGLVGSDLEHWNEMTSRPDGIVLVTGPTGSGKTTTLYSTLKKLATPEVNVSTIEDPIEMIEPAFNQMQVQENIDLGFADGVRSLLRQDPDVIMVGEVRDIATAEMATQAALTGHLVLSTLHTNDSPTTITRLLELGIPSYLIKSTVIGVMAQRLVRTLCEHCKEEDHLDPEVWKELVHPWKVALPKKIYKPVGCLECRNTGFRGRVGIYEILLVDKKVKELIGDNCDVAELRKAGMSQGMRTLRLAGAQKIASGLTTPAEVMRVAPPITD